MAAIFGTTFIVGESYAFITGNTTLSAYIWAMTRTWGSGWAYFVGWMMIGLAFHLWYHWSPPPQ